MHNRIPVTAKTVDGMSRLRHQRGVGLIEIMIAVLVLSIGFLGMAALQARALSDNNSSMMRTQAVFASYAILDAMRADRVNALNGAYNTSVGNLITVGNCPAAAGSLVNFQLHQWCAGSGANPPDGLAALGDGATGAINCDVNGNCKIDVTFNDDRATHSPSATPKMTTITTWAKI